MTINDIIVPLARLASLSFQERYVIGGTAEEYVIPDDLLEDVDSFRFRIDRPENRNLLDIVQRAALEDLFRYIDEHSGEALEVETREAFANKLRHSVIWTELRRRAGAILALFGASPDPTADDVNRMTRH
jgi:hypothetical protein